MLQLLPSISRQIARKNLQSSLLSNSRVRAAHFSRPLLGTRNIGSAIMPRARKVSTEAPVPQRTSSRSMSKTAKAKAEAVEVSDNEIAGASSARGPSNGGKKRVSKNEKPETSELNGTSKKSPRKGRASATQEVSADETSPRKAKRARTSTTDGENAEAETTASPKKGRKSKASEAAEESGDKANEKSPKKAKARKSADSDDTPVSLSAPPAGGSKMDTLADESLPKNLTIPDPLTLSNTPKPNDVTRITSWNILSFKSSLTKGLIRYLEAEDADVVIMTETKCNEVPMHQRLKEMYPHQTWGIGKTKGYAGIAMLCKHKPIKVTTGLPGSDADTKGRIITAEFERYIVIGTYVVNAGEGLKTLEAKKAWQKTFAEHLDTCNKQKPTIWGGDLNVVLDARDLSNASKKWNKSAGYTQAECDAHRATLAGTLVPGSEALTDIWRERHPDAIGHYSYFGFRGQCRQKGIGWRLDTFIIPQRMADQVQDVEIRHEVYGASDHIPVYIDIKGSL